MNIWGIDPVRYVIEPLSGVFNVAVGNFNVPATIIFRAFGIGVKPDGIFSFCTIDMTPENFYADAKVSLGLIIN